MTGLLIGVLALVVLVPLLALMMQRALKRWGAVAVAAMLVIPLGLAPAQKSAGLQRRIGVDLWSYWYGTPEPITGKSRRYPGQERFIFGPHRSDGCAFYQGALTARRWGKTVALARKAILLILLNPGDPGDPVWGGVFGRTRKEAEKRIIRPLLAELRRLKRDLGLDLDPSYDKNNGEIHFANGSAIYIGSYGKTDSLENNRGETLGWAIVDEIERSFIPADDILAVVAVAISDARAKHAAFVWASSPNGLHGMAAKHDEAKKRGDPNYFLVTGTILDNPYLSPTIIAAIRAGLSRRMWAQEGGGVCLSPANHVFVEFDEQLHVVPYRWDPNEMTIVSVDWGTSHGYMCAIKVNRVGRWVVAKERKVTETTPARFRELVVDFIARCQGADRGRLPHLITCDGAVKDERRWLDGTYGQDTNVRWLKKDAEQGIGWGLNLISYMLDPAPSPEDIDPRKTMLFLSDELDPTTDEDTMGIRGAMVMYGYRTEKSDSGDIVQTNEPSKKGGADHPIDALRYALCKGRVFEELHGGKPLPFNDPELDRMRAQRMAKKYDRQYAEAA